MLPKTLFDAHLQPLPSSTVRGSVIGYYDYPFTWGCDFGFGMDKTVIMALRAHIDEVGTDPDYSVVVNYDAHWE